MNLESENNNWIFTIEERKKMTAQMLQELRKGKGLQQKEVASYIGVKATTYNTYESGRTEPPYEILVRLSVLYDISIDIILQKGRTYRNAEDIEKMIKGIQADLDEAEEVIKQHPEQAEQLNALKEGMYKTMEMLKELLKNEELRNIIKA